MSKASYWQRGETLDYKNTGSSTIEANTVVELTGRVGIAGTDIAPGAEGDLHVCGVFEFDKTGTNEIAFGQPVYFDKTGITDAANNGETSGSKVAYTPAGFAAKAAAAGDALGIVDDGEVFPELRHLLGRDGKAQGPLVLRQGEPEPVPGRELVVRGEDLLHPLRGVARAERVFVPVLFHGRHSKTQEI